MRVLENGRYRDMTAEETAEVQLYAGSLNYKDTVISAIREKYSVDDEIAILRQRDTKPEEFLEYFSFVEGVKTAAKNEAD